MDTPTARRLRLAPDADPHELQGWAMDYRFVREVERIERDGRVASRGALELAIGMKVGQIALMRRGRGSFRPVNLAELQRLYNADYKYVLLGQRLRDEGEPVVWREGKGKHDLRQYEPLAYPYHLPAGWAIGPQPEADPRHYPPDPTGAIWIPHPEAPASVRARYAIYKADHPELLLQELELVPARVGRKRKSPAG